MLYMMGTLAIETRPFSVDEMSRSGTADLAEKSVMGGLPPSEFMGDGGETVTLSGQLLPTKLGGLDQLEIAQQMRREGARFPLMRGDGTRLGWFSITSIEEKHRHLLQNGIGFVVAHTITMKRVQGDSGSGQQLISALLDLFNAL